MSFAARPQEEPTGESNKAVFSATTMSSAAAMRNTDELRLYRINACGPKCLKTCTSCQPRWSELPSTEAETAHIAELENEHGIVTRIDPKNGGKAIKVEIQNIHMKDILTDVFEDYPGFHPSLLPDDRAWVFYEPFDMFVDRWTWLLEEESFVEHDKRAAYRSLVTAMTPVIQSTLDSIKRIKDTGLVLWKDLPLIFPPGKLIIVEEPGAVQSVVRVREGETTTCNYKITYDYIDWDGKMHGLNTRTLYITPYTGYKKVRVSDLKTMPLDFCPSEEELRAKLIARGRRWSSLSGVEYKQFAGKKVPVSTGIPIEVST